MKTLLTLALTVAGLAAAHAQHLTTGGATVPVNWQPATNPATLSLDLDGDGSADVQFSYSAFTPSGPGTSTRTFSVSGVAGSALELAVDDNEYDSAHRYQAGDLLEGPVRWQRPSGSYLDYVVTGSGGIGGRGFFRNNAAGYVVLRKPLAGSTQYWWLYIGPRQQAADNWVIHYGTSGAVLATAPATASRALPAFPNPSPTGWQLPQPATYQLFDSRGQLAGHSAAPTGTVEAASLAPGRYTLLLRRPDGTVARQQLVKQ